MDFPKGSLACVLCGLNPTKYFGLSHCDYSLLLLDQLIVTLYVISDIFLESSKDLNDKIFEVKVF